VAKKCLSWSLGKCSNPPLENGRQALHIIEHGDMPTDPQEIYQRATLQPDIKCFPLDVQQANLFPVDP